MASRGGSPLRKIGRSVQPPSWSGRSELAEVMGQADEAPFVADVVEAAQQELSEAAGVLDLAEHGFDDLLAQAVAAAPAGALELDRHRLPGRRLR